MYAGLSSLLILHLLDILDSPPDERTFMNEVGAKCTKWDSVGCELGLGDDVISQIRDEDRRIQARFRRVFQEWSKRKQNRTWRMVINALNAEQVGERKLARDLECKLSDR